MGRKDQYLMKYSRKAIDELTDLSDLTIKEIMSAGVLAFRDLPPDEQDRYVMLAKMGGLKKEREQTIEDAVDVICQTDSHLIPDESAKQLTVMMVRKYGPEALKLVADAIADEQAAADASDDAKRRDKSRHLTG